LNRLTKKALSALPADVQLPRYCREDIGCAIVHLGVGAFHRGHQAWYTEQVMNQFGGNWGIVGASLRSAQAQQQLLPQDGLYSLVVRDSEEQSVQVIGALKEVIVAPQQPQVLLAQLSAEATQLVTLTITEKGYCYDFATQDLDVKHPDIVRDLATYPEQVVSAIGFLVAALDQRCQQQLPLTIISCDNLPANGKLLKQVVLSFAERVKPSLVGWIKKFVSFPCSMVDRIVPATTETDIEALQKILKVDDQAAVFTEPFSQWIIENNFKTPMPAWERVGALLVEDVQPFEEMKLRLLNGSHSLIAYLGYLAGYDYVHQVMADEHLSGLIRTYMDDVAGKTLSMPDSFDLAGYKELLYKRFSNSSLNHKTAQIAQDGSQKIVQRWLSVLRESAQKGRDIQLLSLAIAAWIKYLQGQRDTGDRYQVIDPMAATFNQLTAQHTDSETLIPAVLALEGIFSGLAQELPDILPMTIDWHQKLTQQGVLPVVADYRKALS
jgi:fructuronate reductase